MISIASPRTNSQTGSVNSRRCRSRRLPFLTDDSDFFFFFPLLRRSERVYPAFTRVRPTLSRRLWFIISVFLFFLISFPYPSSTPVPVILRRTIRYLAPDKPFTGTSFFTPRRSRPPSTKSPPTPAILLPPTVRRPNCVGRLVRPPPQSPRLKLCAWITLFKLKKKIVSPWMNS